MGVKEKEQGGSMSNTISPSSTDELLKRAQDQALELANFIDMMFYGFAEDSYIVLNRALTALITELSEQERGPFVRLQCEMVAMRRTDAWRPIMQTIEEDLLPALEAVRNQL
ncbi:MAG: hypothetical protein A2846_04825 [Candidatus Doudnabacteria bacterium RIFCSPHIGHO2_01_FULL_49_9]|uniref:Uncharacterized protein n=1 Tax=Candidatus Doudnabacteria bacterium RIFCSPHIGHO2_01_FULL_49_9 TaxID=1817827 RepID=A0A1F5P3T5_9BACT|nr:MAG: hypothetical protein A2846_04825 [Candidatus Doudnabacteria bacterium RIFCSPHIGHO2_01_FULL_49_9]